MRALAFLYALALAAVLSAPGGRAQAQAQGLPWAYDVTGVADDDVLWIRAAPDPEAEILGELGPHQLRVEVLETTSNGQWGRVATHEGNGWASMHYLRARGDYDPFGVLVPMTCSGTEPFWTLFMEEEDDYFVEPGATARVIRRQKELAGNGAGFAVTYARDPGEHLALSVRRAACSDGMSDREFGFAASLIFESPGRDRALFGCCTLDMR